MDAERIAELRDLYVTQRGCAHGASRDEIADLLDTAEREAVLREALSSVLTVIDGDYGINGKTSLCVRAAEVLLEQGGGE